MERLPPFSSLLSPPEPALLSEFGQEQQQAGTSATTMSKPNQTGQLAKLTGPLSPPISPPVDLLGKPESTDAHNASDLVLYPEDNSHGDAAEPALFPQSTEEPREANRVRDQVPSKSEGSHHTLETRTVDGSVRIRFNAGAWGPGRYNGDTMAYIYALREANRRSRARLQADRDLSAGLEAAVLPQAAPVRSPDRQYRVTKPGRSAMAQTTTLLHAVAPARKQRPTPAPTRKAPRNTTPSEKVAPKKKPEDVDFASLRDLSPDISTLRDRNALKVDVPASNPLDLQNDPHRDELDPAELRLAASLRLTCATYLCSKRRIFLARVEKLQLGKDFRKTDAQQACNIDVNKASKLWTVYDKVGWFQDRHFKHLL